MIFHKLTIAHFRSFQDAQTFHFPTRNGFYCITGRNLVDPDLGANAAGKSSLWDALVWVLYGKTARGLRAGNVANWEKEGLTCGSVEFSIGDDYYSLVRTWSPNSLTIQRKGWSKPRAVEQAYVSSLLGLDHDSFLAVVLMGQFNRFFFDLSKEEKLQVFGRILGLRYWADKSDEARQLARQAESKVVRIDKEMAAVGATISILRQQRDLKRNEVQERLGLRDKRIEELVAEANRLDGELFKCDHQISRFQKLAARHESAKRKHEKQLVRSDWVLRKAQQELAKASQRLADAKQLAGGICPVCKRPVARPSMPVGVQKDHDHFRSKVVSAQAIVDQLMNKLRSDDSVLKAAQADLANRLQWRAKYNAERRAAKDELDRLKSDPGKDELLQLESGLAAAKVRKVKLDRQLSYHKANLNAYQYWQKEFKAVRLWLVESALQQLEIEVSNALAALGLREWRISFAVEAPTKAGKLAKGFRAMIRPPADVGAIPIECYSGGETQRIRIAGAIGLANLVRSRTGIKPNLEVWDEAATWLSEEGVADLLAYFECRSREEQRQIWLVDHTTRSAGNFDGMVEIVKTAYGSIIKGRSYHYGVER